MSVLSMSSRRHSPGPSPPQARRPAGGLRERNKQAKLERIRQAARQLFARKGFEATTTREIARRARVATGTLFLYARDKRELLVRLFREDCERGLHDAYASVPADEGLLAQVLHTFESKFDHYARTPELARVFLKEVLFVPEVSSLALDDMHRLGDLVALAQQRREIRPDVPPLVVAANLFSLYYFVVHTWVGGFFTRDTARQLMCDALEAQLRGLMDRQ